MSARRGLEPIACRYKPISLNQCRTLVANLPIHIRDERRVRHLRRQRSSTLPSEGCDLIQKTPLPESLGGQVHHSHPGLATLLNRKDFSSVGVLYDARIRSRPVRCAFCGPSLEPGKRLAAHIIKSTYILQCLEERKATYPPLPHRPPSHLVGAQVDSLFTASFNRGIYLFWFLFSCCVCGYNWALHAKAVVWCWSLAVAFAAGRRFTAG